MFPRERLSEALAATHRAGFGPYTRVLDGQRLDVGSQLARAGLEIVAGAAPDPGDVLIVVQAPGRVDRVAELFHQLGAQAVAHARGAGVLTVAKAAPADGPDIRLPVSGGQLSSEIS
ncbi:MAG: hypothetical protein QM692_02070 [Thermomicrobiales bacterium]